MMHRDLLELERLKVEVKELKAQLSSKSVTDIIQLGDGVVIKILADGTSWMFNNNTNFKWKLIPEEQI